MIPLIMTNMDDNGTDHIAIFNFYNTGSSFELNMVCQDGNNMV